MWEMKSVETKMECADLLLQGWEPYSVSVKQEKSFDYKNRGEYHSVTVFHFKRPQIDVPSLSLENDK